MREHVVKSPSFHSRRSFLKTTAIGGLSGAGWWVATNRATAAPGDDIPEASVPAEYAAWVQLLEQTPRERILPVFAEQVRRTPDEPKLLAALLLAGVRNVEPRPSVGFKFHTVLVNQSLHLAHLKADRDRKWLPLFWGLDYFKETQRQDSRERGWALDPVPAERLPKDDEAAEAFLAAMEQWQEAEADAAIAVWTRRGPSRDLWEAFFRFGCRDFRSIGHKIIDVANTHRVLGITGWAPAESALRSLAYALLMHEDGNPAGRQDRADHSWRRNQDLVREIRRFSSDSARQPQRTLQLVARFRECNEDEACDSVVEALNQGTTEQSVWDALFLASLELLLRQNGIVALHAVTTTNAMHYVRRQTTDAETARLLLLQNAAFLPLFREAMAQRGRVDDTAIDELRPGSKPIASPEAVFDLVESDTTEAVARSLRYFQDGGSVSTWSAVARRLLIDKSTGAHDYKYGYAILENAEFISENFRPLLLSAACCRLLGSRRPDCPLITEAKRALGTA
ncbi:MAG: twin-arginine translocation signal domain-containing protein [Planctomycetota bacterium]|nr:MAG: twin-arginine translocation signal domain-containing protein [Planctomycetota bacterium]